MLAVGHGLSPASGPFHHFRETTLDYHGPAADFTNLTEIRIGWFGPTNLDDPLTGDLWWAANRAVQEANESNAERARRNPEFRDLPFRLVPRWAANPWGTGVAQLTRMVYDEQPLALIGSVDSAATHLAEQVAAKANLPLVSPVATDPSVTLAGVPWMFACAPSDKAIARVLVSDILAALPPGGTRNGDVRIQQAEPDAGHVQPAAAGQGCQLALLTGTDHESRMTAREVVRELSRRGRLPDFRFEVTPGAERAGHLQELAAARPAIVLVVAGTEEAARWVIAVREAVPAAHIFGSQSAGRTRFRELAGPAAEGVRFPLLSTADPGDAGYARFAGRFEAERGGTPDGQAVVTYDATCLLIEAIRQAGPNRARIRERLTQLSPWPGLAGLIQFDGTGQNSRTNLGLGTIRNNGSAPGRGGAGTR